MNLQKRIKRNLLGAAGDLPSSTWPSEWKRRTGEGFSGADLIYVSSNDIQRRFVYLYGEVQAAIDFDLPIDLRLTAQSGYQVRFLYQPTQRASENPRVVAYFNAGAHFWTRELQTSTAKADAEEPRDWLICEDSIELNEENTQPKATLALESGLFDQASAATDVTTSPERDLPIAQEPGWPVDPGELHFSGKALGTEITPELATGVSVFVHLKPLTLDTSEPMPEFAGDSARYWVEKDGRAYMPICRGGGVHRLTLPVAEDCGWAGGGVYTGTSAYVSFTDANEAGAARLQVAPTDPDADDDAQHIGKVWEIRNDADEDDLEVNGRTATLRFESVYHADPHEALACIVGPYKLDIVEHRQPDHWPSVEEAQTIDLQVKVHYAVSGKPEPGIVVEWRNEDERLETQFTGEDGWTVLRYQPTADATITAVADSPYKPEADTQAFVVKTIPTRLWGQFELSVGDVAISPEEHWWILPGQSYQLTLTPRADSVLIGEELVLTVDPVQRLQLAPTGARPLVAGGLSWSVTTAQDATGDFALHLDCIRFKQPLEMKGGVNELPPLTVEEAAGEQLDPLQALTTLTALVPHYEGMRSTDEINVTWTGAAGSPEEGSHTTPAVEVGPVEEKEIPLPVSLIAFSLGQSVTVSYTVTPAGGTSLPASDALALSIGALPQSALEPSKPRILQATQEGHGEELDMRSVSDDLTIRIDSWPHIAHNQRTWIRVEGTKSDGSTYQKVWSGTGSWVSKDWYDRGYGEKIIPYDELPRLRDSSTLKIELKASFNQSTDESHAITFPLRTYTVRATIDLPAPDVEQATGSAPDQQLNPVAAKEALTVVIPDYGIQAGDQVSVTWAGAVEEGSHTTELQALPDSREIPIPVPVIAYNLGQSVTVTYTLTRNGEVRPPSAALTLAVQTMPVEALEPSKPRILQAAEEGNGAELDVGSVSGDVMVRVDSWPHVAHGQRTWLRVEGTNRDDSPYEKDLWRGSGNWVSAEWYRQGYGEKSIPYNDLRGLRSGSTLKLVFKASFNQSIDESQATTFPLRTYTVRNLSVPSVKQATGTVPNQQLNPVAAEDALTVVIPNYGVQPGDQVSVTWAGVAGEGSYTTAMQALPASHEIAIPVTVVGYNLNRSVTVSYTMIYGNNEPLSSDLLNLAVQAFELDDLLAAKPKILQATGSIEGPVLDLKYFSADVTCWVGVWPLIAPDQDVWLRLKGTKADGNVPYDLNIWAPPPRGPRTNPTWINQGFYEVTAAYSYLEQLKDGSTLTMEFKADLSKATDEANASNFPLRTYTIKVSPPTVESVKDPYGREIPNFGSTLSTTLKLSGKVSKGQKVEIFYGEGGVTVSKGLGTVDPITGLWTHDITVPGSGYVFAMLFYHSGSPRSSNVSNFLVVPLLTPTLESVKDSNKQEIPDGHSTTSTELILNGKASRGQKVEIFDDSGASAVSKGQTKSDILFGNWSLTITVLQGFHRLYAKSLYHSSGEVYSNVRTLTVT
ncbi:hypothetical protein [Pseudomonas corrugata]|uniref:hypothetical protein n=1 Tax=Pseudomonas corrugata TaxID=47879 RepID=UPI001586E6C4|nr:hypothetical protein [Pseudomonas corrugata]MCI0994020.1 hypothetical protein [Pseudomonas corrugata]NUT67087.1 hypothetical protein [Pseudomonas corrugata]